LEFPHSLNQGCIAADKRDRGRAESLDLTDCFDWSAAW